MAITNTQSLYQYTLGSINQALAYPVYFLDSSDITVIATDPATKLDTTLVLNDDYSVTGAGNQVGGTVTMAPGIVGNIVTVYLTPNLTQPTSFVENGAFSESTIEQTVDRLCMEIHELNDQLQRTLRLPNSNAVTTPFPVTSRLDGIPYFDSVTGALGLVTRQSIIIAAQTGTATVPANTILGNDTGSVSGPLALTPIRVRSLAFANAFGLVGGAYIDKTANLVTTTGKLDTAQDIRSSSFVQFGQLTLDSSSTTATNLIFENDSGSKIWYVRLKGSAANVDSFELYNATDNTTALRLLASGGALFPSGGVGIGASPDAKLRVQGTASAMAIGLADGGDNYFDGANHIFRSFAGTTKMTLDSAGSLSFGISGRGILGTSTNDSAAVGVVGEYVANSLVSGSATALTTSVAKNVTSISLTAGDWSISGLVHFSLAGTTTSAWMVAAIGTTSATLPGIDTGQQVQYPFPVSAGAAAFQNTIAIPEIRVSVASPTTVYLIADASFSVSTMAASGTIIARRVR